METILGEIVEPLRRSKPLLRRAPPISVQLHESIYKAKDKGDDL